MTKSQKLSQTNRHCWNVVQLQGRDYVVDVLHNPGHLYDVRTSHIVFSEYHLILLLLFFYNSFVDSFSLIYEKSHPILLFFVCFLVNNCHPKTTVQLSSAQADRYLEVDTSTQHDLSSYEDPTPTDTDPNGLGIVQRWIKPADFSSCKIERLEQLGKGVSSYLLFFLPQLHCARLSHTTHTCKSYKHIRFLS